MAGSSYALGLGANDTDTSAQFRTQDADSGSSSSNAGAIAGGVVGGVLGLALIAVLVWYFLVYRKRKQERDSMKEKQTLGSGGDSSNVSPSSVIAGNPYESPRFSQSLPAADDVEEATAGYNAQFR